MTKKDGRHVVLALTPSQQMALIDIIAASMSSPDHPQVYVDVVRDVETTTSELLALVINAPRVQP